MTESDIKRLVREQFAGSGDAYVRSVGHRLGKDLPRLLELAELSPETHALDLATGGGHTAVALAPLVDRIVAADFTPHMLVQSRTNFGSSGLQGQGFVATDAEDLSFADAIFDLVTCRIAPHHFPNVERAVGEVSRVLRPGGLFLLIDSLAPADPVLDGFINTLEKRRDPSHVRSYTLAEWQGFLERAGLIVEHTEIIEKRHQFADWTARSRMTDAERDDLGDWVLDADPSTKAYFRIEEADGRVISFLDEKLMVKARKSV